MAVKAKDLKVGDNVRLCMHDNELESNFHYVFGRDYPVTEIKHNKTVYIRNERGNCYGWEAALDYFEKVEEQIFNNYTE